MQWDQFLLIHLIFLRPCLIKIISANIVEIIYLLSSSKQYKQSLSLSDQSLGLNFSPVFFFQLYINISTCYFTQIIIKLNL